MGNRIKHFREKRIPTMTIEDLSHNTGIPLGSLCVYESGKRRASRKVLKKIAFEFDIDWTILDPEETPVFNPDADKPKPSDCEHLCKDMTIEDKLMIKNYKKLDDKAKMECRHIVEEKVLLQNLHDKTA